MLRLCFVFLFAAIAPVFGAWTVHQESGDSSKIEVHNDGRPVARFVYGPKELKPYLHLFGANGELLTEWDAKQQFPHHRGIFIGWNKIESELGSSDLWHLRSGEKMTVRSVKHSTTATNATIIAEVEWNAQKRDDVGDSVLILETRRLDISRPADRKTQVDAHFTLVAMRDVTLNGDLQHAGIHFRGSHELTKRNKETRYIWEPDLPGPGGKVVSTDLKWCRLIFPIGASWYAATE
jgi:hypothetical protein